MLGVPSSFCLLSHVNHYLCGRLCYYDMMCFIFSLFLHVMSHFYCVIACFLIKMCTFA